jgi:hypothetical protein
MGHCTSSGQSIDMLEYRSFALHQQSYSPYAYRVAAIRNLARVLALSIRDDSQPSDIEAVDHAVVGWHLNLPEDGSPSIGESNLTDGMMFQAHMFNRCASILLHFPRSSLPMTVPISTAADCAQSCTALAPVSNLHTAKALLASKEIANLVALPCTLDTHSPLIICGIILSSMVHLAAASALYEGTGGQNSIQYYQDNVALLFGALSGFGKKWNVASRALSRLRTVANTVFPLPQSMELADSTTSAHDSGIELEQIPSDLSWFDLLTPGELMFTPQGRNDTNIQQGLFCSLPSLPANWP